MALGLGLGVRVQVKIGVRLSLHWAVFALSLHVDTVHASAPRMHLHTCLRSATVVLLDALPITARAEDSEGAADLLVRSSFIVPNSAAECEQDLRRLL